MAKKRGKNTVAYHVKHKSKLTLLLILKIILAFACFYIAFTLFSYVQPFFGTLFSGLIAMAVFFLLYLFIIIRVLKFFKFK